LEQDRSFVVSDGSLYWWDKADAPSSTKQVRDAIKAARNRPAIMDGSPPTTKGKAKKGASIVRAVSLKTRLGFVGEGRCVRQDEGTDRTSESCWVRGLGLTQIRGGSGMTAELQSVKPATPIVVPPSVGAALTRRIEFASARLRDLTALITSPRSTPASVAPYAEEIRMLQHGTDQWISHVRTSLAGHLEYEHAVASAEAALRQQVAGLHAATRERLGLRGDGDKGEASDAHGEGATLETEAPGAPAPAHGGEKREKIEKREKREKKESGFARDDSWPGAHVVTLILRGAGAMGDPSSTAISVMHRRPSGAPAVVSVLDTAAVCSWKDPKAGQTNQVLTSDTVWAAIECAVSGTNEEIRLGFARGPGIAFVQVEEWTDDDPGSKQTRTVWARNVGSGARVVLKRMSVEKGK